VAAVEDIGDGGGESVGKLLALDLAFEAGANPHIGFALRAICLNRRIDCLIGGHRAGEDDGIRAAADFIDKCACRREEFLDLTQNCSVSHISEILSDQIKPAICHKVALVGFSIRGFIGQSLL
jgi:hypothetical protein